MKISIIVPLSPNLEVNPSKDLNVQGKIPTIMVKGRNPSENRNMGVKKSKTNFVAFINGHTSLSDNWAEKVEKFFLEHPEIDIVGGPQLTPRDSGLFERASGYAFESAFGAAGVNARYKPSKLNLNADETMITSANLICKKEVFKKVQFDESIYPGEDPKFISDARKAGLKVAYSPDDGKYLVIYQQNVSPDSPTNPGKIYGRFI